MCYTRAAPAAICAVQDAPQLGQHTTVRTGFLGRINLELHVLVADLFYQEFWHHYIGILVQTNPSILIHRSLRYRDFRGSSIATLRVRLRWLSGVELQQLIGGFGPIRVSKSVVGTRQH